MAHAHSAYSDDEEALFLAPTPKPGRRLALIGVSVFSAGLASATLATAAVVVHSSASRGSVDEHVGLAAKRPATTGRANCNVTHSCASPGMQCYEQNAGYAQCRSTCVPGPDPTHWDGQHWSCKELGERTPGEDACVDQNQDCRQSKCCRQPGHTCFEKTQDWATCLPSCQPGPRFADVDGTPWTCKKLGETAVSTAQWVAGQCSAGAGSNCLSTGCCKNAGEMCYKKNDYYGECRPGCSDPGWSCQMVGVRTPPPGEEEILPIPDWGFEQCSQPETGCKDSGCCIGMDMQCYQKDENWAQCKTWCKPGPLPEDHNDTWGCTTIGPRSYGASEKGFPSLYCFSVIRTQGYEVGLMQAQFSKGAGIFGCDEYSLLSADGTTTVGNVKTTWFQGAPITRSVDNTAGNTELFVHAWNAVINANKWRSHAFTLKVDPDAVMLVDRMRLHMRPHIGKKMFIINCPWGDMIFGALEVFSYHAILEWSMRHNECPAPNNWGEDKYMTHCMDVLGVQRVRDIPILADNLCLGSDCGNAVAAAFHPYKDVGAWLQCWGRATAGAPQVDVIFRK